MICNKGRRNGFYLFRQNTIQLLIFLPQNLKVSKFQNEFLKTSFLPKYEPNIVRISALYCATLQGKNPYNFGSYFGRNDVFINSFWNLLTFRQRLMGPVNPLFRRSCVHIIIFALCILIIAKRRVLFSDVITDVNLSVNVGFLPLK